jgi:N6-adenosine-specific RNA methylase IME4
VLSLARLSLSYSLAAASFPATRRLDTSWFHWTRPHNNHSAKPEAFLDLVEQVSPGPYLELFARRQRLGWDTWGDEALEHVALV